MGYFSGKCDFQDHIEIFDIKDTFDEWNKKSKVYINDKIIKFNKFEDLIPYYTHIISAMFSSKNDDGTFTQTIHLSSWSWLEIEEARYGPSKYRIERMKEFDKFVRDSGYEPLWAISLEEREAWKPCPYGLNEFCEPKFKREDGKTGSCYYMYANKIFPCKFVKYFEKQFCSNCTRADCTKLSDNPNIECDEKRRFM